MHDVSPRLWDADHTRDVLIIFVESPTLCGVQQANDELVAHVRLWGEVWGKEREREREGNSAVFWDCHQI
jgi:hypothetical protein